jgi:hypothetical protein
MILRLLQGALLLALTVAIHAIVLSALLSRITSYQDRLPLRFAVYTWVLVRIAIVTIVAHLLEIALWAVFFAWKEALPDIETALYFSAVTYATIGYGDIVLPEGWRLLSAFEGLTGILMCGWSAAFFFAVVHRLYPGGHRKS